MSKIGITKAFNLEDGRSISIETGKLAKQADGSVVVRMGDAMLLATVVSNKEPKEGADFLPLSVDYQEKFAAVGRFPGGFFKREARLTDYEILISRLIDRALRPLFPEDYHAEIQVLVTLISADKNIMPDTLAGLAASAAISISDIPFNGPMSEVRVARINNKLIVNPTIPDLEKADIDIIVAATMENIMMVEGEMREVSEEEMLEAIKIAHEAIKIQCQAQLDLVKLCGKEKRTYSHEQKDLALKEDIKKLCSDKIYEVARNINNSKYERREAFDLIKQEYIDNIKDESIREEKEFLLDKYFHDLEKEIVRTIILKEGIRLDGRKHNEIRPIWSEVNYLPSAHGSAIFTRGETQSLTTVTLGTKLDEQLIDAPMLFGTSKFILHYNFPAFSTGEVKPSRGPGRREIGHGNLAMRSLRIVVPQDNDNPYTIRLVSDILESNGSSSMATVCAGTLALMDAGIKIKAPVSGIAMGLITDEQGNYAVLSDILGDEDHIGDMDFKVTGTAKGICGCQMDIKMEGLSYEILLKALHQAKAGRLHILQEMTKTIAEPREDYKPHAPRIVKIIIPKDFIGAVIGPGGKIIQEMQRESGTVISIEEVNGVGVVEISSSDKSSIDIVLEKIKGITTTPEIGEVYEGKVKNIQPFGAFVEFLPGKDGLLHISEITWERLENMNDILKEGEQIKVKLIDIDKKTGKYKLSRKVLLPRPERQPVKKES